MFQADLHCHSTHSDGLLSPKDLVTLAKEKKLQGLSITDHDAISAYTEALAFAKEQDIELLSGIELSCGHQMKGQEKGATESVHVLGYGFNVEDPDLKALCKKACLARKERNYTMAEKLAAQGIALDIDRLYRENSAGSIGRPHLAKQMVEKSYVASFKEAFIQFIGDGKSCFVPMERTSVEQGIAAIQKAQGFAFLAHPHLLKNSLLEQELFQMGFDGVEARYAKMPPSKNARFEKLAKKKKWLVSAGSDFHGEGISFANLGDSFVGREIFDELKQGRA